MEMNKEGKLPDELIESAALQEKKPLEYTDGAGEESVTRFEKNRGRKKKKKRRPPPHNQAKKS